jgi:hypothetical protein
MNGANLAREAKRVHTSVNAARKGPGGTPCATNRVLPKKSRVRVKIPGFAFAYTPCQAGRFGISSAYVY